MNRDMAIFLASGLVWFLLYVIIALLERAKDRRIARRGMRQLARRIERDKELQLR